MPLLSQPSSPCCSCTPTSFGSIFAHRVGMITGAISQAAGERLNSFSSTSALRWGTYHRFLGATHDCNPNHRGDLAAQGSHPARTCHGRFCRLERRKRTRCRGANGGYGAPSGKTRRPSGQAPGEAHWSHGEASRKAPVTPIWTRWRGYESKILLARLSLAAATRHTTMDRAEHRNVLLLGNARRPVCVRRPSLSRNR